MIPPQANAEFAAAMEQVLDVDHRPYDPDYPVVCMDETPRQLIGEVRMPIAARPGQLARHDYEYRRAGCAMCSWPLSRWQASGSRR